MKAITTRYLGPTFYKGSRIVASDSDGNQTTISIDSADRYEDSHKKAALSLCLKMQWTGRLIGGGIKNGMVWVFDNTHDVAEAK